MDVIANPAVRGVAIFIAHHIILRLKPKTVF